MGCTFSTLKYRDAYEAMCEAVELPVREARLASSPRASIARRTNTFAVISNDTDPSEEEGQARSVPLGSGKSGRSDAPSPSPYLEEPKRAEVGQLFKHCRDAWPAAVASNGLSYHPLAAHLCARSLTAINTARGALVAVNGSSGRSGALVPAATETPPIPTATAAASSGGVGLAREDYRPWLMAVCESFHLLALLQERKSLPKAAKKFLRRAEKMKLRTTPATAHGGGGGRGGDALDQEWPRLSIAARDIKAAALVSLAAEFPATTDGHEGGGDGRALTAVDVMRAVRRYQHRTYAGPDRSGSGGGSNPLTQASDGAPVPLAMLVEWAVVTQALALCGPEEDPNSYRAATRPTPPPPDEGCDPCDAGDARAHGVIGAAGPAASDPRLRGPVTAATLAAWAAELERLCEIERDLNALGGSGSGNSMKGDTDSAAERRALEEEKAAIEARLLELFGTVSRGAFSLDQAGACAGVCEAFNLHDFFASAASHQQLSDCAFEACIAALESCPSPAVVESLHGFRGYFQLYLHLFSLYESASRAGCGGAQLGSGGGGTVGPMTTAEAEAALLGLPAHVQSRIFAAATEGEGINGFGPMLARMDGEGGIPFETLCYVVAAALARSTGGDGDGDGNGGEDHDGDGCGDHENDGAAFTGVTAAAGDDLPLPDLTELKRVLGILEEDDGDVPASPAAVLPPFLLRCYVNCPGSSTSSSGHDAGAVAPALDAFVEAIRSAAQLQRYTSSPGLAALAAVRFCAKATSSSSSQGAVATRADDGTHPADTAAGAWIAGVAALTADPTAEARAELSATCGLFAHALFTETVVFRCAADTQPAVGGNDKDGSCGSGGAPPPPPPLALDSHMSRRWFGMAARRIAALLRLPVAALLDSAGAVLAARGEQPTSSADGCPIPTSYGRPRRPAGPTEGRTDDKGDGKGGEDEDGDEDEAAISLAFTALAVVDHPAGLHGATALLGDLAYLCCFNRTRALFGGRAHLRGYYVLPFPFDARGVIHALMAAMRLGDEQAQLLEFFTFSHGRRSVRFCLAVVNGDGEREKEKENKKDGADSVAFISALYARYRPAICCVVGGEEELSRWCHAGIAHIASAARAAAESRLSQQQQQLISNSNSSSSNGSNPDMLAICDGGPTDCTEGNAAFVLTPRHYVSLLEYLLSRFIAFAGHKATMAVNDSSMVAETMRSDTIWRRFIEELILFRVNDDQRQEQQQQHGQRQKPRPFCSPAMDAAEAEEAAALAKRVFADLQLSEMEGSGGGGGGGVALESVAAWYAARRAGSPTACKTRMSLWLAVAATLPYTSSKGHRVARTALVAELQEQYRQQFEVEEEEEAERRRLAGRDTNGSNDGSNDSDGDNGSSSGGRFRGCPGDGYIPVELLLSHRLLGFPRGVVPVMPSCAGVSDWLPLCAARVNALVGRPDLGSAELHEQDLRFFFAYAHHDMTVYAAFEEARAEGNAIAVLRARGVLSCSDDDNADDDGIFTNSPRAMARRTLRDCLTADLHAHPECIAALLSDERLERHYSHSYNSSSSGGGDDPSSSDGDRHGGGFAKEGNARLDTEGIAHHTADALVAFAHRLFMAARAEYLEDLEAAALESNTLAALDLELLLGRHSAALDGPVTKVTTTTGAHGAGGTYWQRLRHLLPCGLSPLQRDQRRRLWAKVDLQAKGFVTLAEAHRGVTDVLRLGEFRADLSPVLYRAFAATVDMFGAQTGVVYLSASGEQFVTPPQFRVFLSYLYSYMELYFMFDLLSCTGLLDCKGHVLPSALDPALVTPAIAAAAGKMSHTATATTTGTAICATPTAITAADTDGAAAAVPAPLLLLLVAVHCPYRVMAEAVGVRKQVTLRQFLDAHRVLRHWGVHIAAGDMAATFADINRRARETGEMYFTGFVAWASERGLHPEGYGHGFSESRDEIASIEARLAAAPAAM